MSTRPSRSGEPISSETEFLVPLGWCGDDDTLWYFGAAQGIFWTQRVARR